MDEPAGYCPRCGYQLDPGVCPECGTAVTPYSIWKRDPLAWRRKRNRALIGSLFLAAFAYGLSRPALWVQSIPYLPTAWVCELATGPGPGRSAAYAELQRRFLDPTVTDREIYPYLRRVLYGYWPFSGPCVSAGKIGESVDGRWVDGRLELDLPKCLDLARAPGTPGSVMVLDARHSRRGHQVTIKAELRSRRESTSHCGFDTHVIEYLKHTIVLDPVTSLHGDIEVDYVLEVRLVLADKPFVRRFPATLRVVRNPAQLTSDHSSEFSVTNIPYHTGHALYSSSSS